MREALDIQVKGIVQGVGFRPFVYRAAKRHLVDGWVLNAADGVFVHAEGEAKLLDQFVLELSENPPAASKVDEVSLAEAPLEGFDSFEIRFSDAGAKEKTTLVSPDLASCEDCARELFDPADRRFRYPFINCTNCGPRFTIIEKLPYDRKSTSMKEFPMCGLCSEEYRDPADRRFHAQPDACFACGPHLIWREHEGLPGALESPPSPSGERSRARPKPAPQQADAAAPSPIEAPLGPATYGADLRHSDAILARAVELLLAGRILAVKGLGGFHLVCDAQNPGAVALLRARKRREGKAFAVMADDLTAVRSRCEVSEVEAEVLSSRQRPIVLLRKRAGASFAPGLADALPELGVMLPYTPLQHLLLHDFTAVRPGGMLVMTSGNVHDEPIVIDDGDAASKLFSLADAFLGHDRAILARYDDSVVRVIAAGGAGEAVQVLRRARGYAPLPIVLARPSGERGGPAPAGAPAPSGASATAAAPAPAEASEGGPARPRGELALLAVGPEQKNTFALVRGDEVFVSQHVGDVENAETFDAWLEAKRRFEGLFETRPRILACDLHPEYLTRKWACDQSRAKGLELVEVQHHHAHIASVMGEHGLSDPVCGVAFDGTGYGADGAVWGGEVLLSKLDAYERFANFAYVPLPGGAAAVRHPLRTAFGVLWAFDLLDHPGARAALDALGDQAGLCLQMIERGVNTPQTSSVGRLFDAASALLGVCTDPSYEGEAAILLEAALGRPPQPGLPSLREAASDEGAADVGEEAAAAERYAVAVVKNAATAASTARDTSVVLLDAAPTFRALLDDAAAGVATPLVARRFHDAFVQAVLTVAELVRGVYGIRTVALSGGVFMNRYLIEHVLAALERAGFTAAVNKDLPPNDGCISFGQAVVAWALDEQDAL